MPIHDARATPTKILGMRSCTPCVQRELNAKSMTKCELCRSGMRCVGLQRRATVTAISIVDFGFALYCS